MGLMRRSLLPTCFTLWVFVGVAHAAPSLSDAQVANLEARKAFEKGDLTTAIREWERAYSALPPENEGQRAQLSAQLAATHKKLYDHDGQLAHLDRALELYRRTLDELGAEPLEVRSQFQKAYDQVAEERKRVAERANSPEPSPSQPNDERVGPAEPSIHVPGEEVPLLDPYFASTLPTHAAPRQVDRQKWSTARQLGAASLALAASGLVGVGVGLGFGERADRLGEAELDKSSPSSLRLQEIRVSGENSNAAAIGCGVTAGAFAVVGAVLLIVDRVRPTGRRRTAWRPTVGGLDVRF